MNSDTAKRGSSATIPRAEIGVVGPPFCSSKQGSGNRGLATQNWCWGTPGGGVVGPPFRAETGVWEHHEQIQGKNNRSTRRERLAASCSLALRRGCASLGKKESKARGLSEPVHLTPQRHTPGSATPRGSSASGSSMVPDPSAEPYPDALPRPRLKEPRRAEGPRPRSSGYQQRGVGLTRRTPRVDRA
jgi:hypothetical protein